MENESVVRWNSFKWTTEHTEFSDGMAMAYPYISPSGQYVLTQYSDSKFISCPRVTNLLDLTTSYYKMYKGDKEVFEQFVFVIWLSDLEILSIFTDDLAGSLSYFHCSMDYENHRIDVLTEVNIPPIASSHQGVIRSFYQHIQLARIRKKDYLCSIYHDGFILYPVLPQPNSDVTPKFFILPRPYRNIRLSLTRPIIWKNTAYFLPVEEFRVDGEDLEDYKRYYLDRVISFDLTDALDGETTHIYSEDSPALSIHTLTKVNKGPYTAEWIGFWQKENIVVLTEIFVKYDERQHKAIPKNVWILDLDKLTIQRYDFTIEGFTHFTIYCGSFLVWKFDVTDGDRMKYKIIQNSKKVPRLSDLCRISLLFGEKRASLECLSKMKKFIFAGF